MYYVYLLKSKKNESLYFGFTTDLRKRLKEHNDLSNKSTKPYAPWELIYYEAYNNKEMAQMRENNLKYFGKAYGQLKKEDRPLRPKGAGGG